MSTDYGKLWETVLGYNPRAERKKDFTPGSNKHAFLSWIENVQNEYYGEGGIYEPGTAGSTPGAVQGGNPTAGSNGSNVGSASAPKGGGGGGTFLDFGASLWGGGLMPNSGTPQQEGDKMPTRFSEYGNR